MTQPKLIIHGGLGKKVKSAQLENETRNILRQIAENAFTFLQNHSAVETAVYAVSLLEDNPCFNAGTGSKLQSDGIARMTASVMDGYRQRFAGVINIIDVKNPVQIAARLLEYKDRVLAGKEALMFARAHGFPAHNPITPRRRQEYEGRLRDKSETVGCVALDAQGRLAAATSTGGKGFELPGRVSDSATVAGNYANAFAAISCTGTGEDIVDTALAASIAIRVADEMPLSEACIKSIAEAAANGRYVGIIALNANGNMHQASTEPYLNYAMYDGTATLPDKLSLNHHA